MTTPRFTHLFLLFALLGACAPDDPWDTKPVPMNDPMPEPYKCKNSWPADIDPALFTMEGDVAADSCGADVAVEYVQQDKSQWCWAAVTEMVGRYYNRDLAQCEVVADYYNLSRDACCAAGEYNDLSDPCNHGGTTYAAIGRVALVTYKSTPDVISEAQLRHELMNARPVELSIKSEDSSHAVLVVGYSLYNGGAYKYRVFDPFQGRYAADYDTLMTGLKLHGKAAPVYITLYGMRAKTEDEALASN